jgi:tetratricopeptide (TPR) repeat protein
LRRIYTIPVIKQVRYLVFVMILIITGCALQKKNAVNRGLQNLTAHYNILFNANELLKAKQESYALSFIDSYGEILNVYQDTIAKSATMDKDLDAAIVRANKVINEKEQSHYIGDAYLVLGKAHFLAGNYFNAAEYFSYVIHSFPKQVNLTQEAAVWQARALLYLNNLPDAKLVLDTARQNINPKKNITADVYAAQLQYDINAQNYADAEEMAKKAIQYSSSKPQRLRWTFILGQLQELNQKNNEAIASYTRIVKSNSSFEMSFNANLNRIRIEDMRNGVKMDRVTRLLSLLKDDNNKDFKDQIYYQVGSFYEVNKNLDNAVKYYNLSIRSSVKNQNQKGLSYLRIADIDFKEKADYVSAKNYYDSTLTNLSPNYPGYQTIQKKSNNLQLLVDKLQIIAFEDTMQILARQDEPARLEHIDAMVMRETLKQNTINTNNTTAGNSNNIFNNNAPGTQAANAPGGSNFYFYNANAVSQGYTDFKRRWGNRKPEDDWRRSNRSGSDITNTNATTSIAAASSDPDALPVDMRKSTTDVTAGAYRQKLVQNLPLTPDLLAQSNSRIYNAYLDIANFYRDILADKREAITGYELLLSKYPADPNNAAVYYSLYRLYSDIDAARSTDYKNRLIKEYPETVFAKVILDPDYGRKTDDNDALFNTTYNQVYDLYRQKKYTQVITRIDELIKQYPNNRLLAQLYYLRAIAAGHQERYDPFRADLEQIVNKYPEDKLVTPLAVQHLFYLETNKAELAALPVVLMNNDTSEVIFSLPIAYQKQTPYNRERTAVTVTQTRVEPQAAQPAKAPVVAPPVVVAPTVKKEPVINNPVVQAPVKKDEAINTPVAQAPVNTDVITPPVQTPVVEQPKPPVKIISTLFNTRDSTSYYFVVNVSTGTTDLSSSRFGIGQFNRTHFNGNTVVHRLKTAGPDNQLIYVGKFNSLTAVKDYARAIAPIMPEIMKVPKDKYSFFIITKENLDKLAGKKLLDSYIDYYQQTY